MAKIFKYICTRLMTKKNIKLIIAFLVLYVALYAIYVNNGKTSELFSLIIAVITIDTATSLEVSRKILHITDEYFRWVMYFVALIYIAFNLEEIMGYTNFFNIVTAFLLPIKRSLGAYPNLLLNYLFVFSIITVLIIDIIDKDKNPNCN